MSSGSDRAVAFTRSAAPSASRRDRGGREGLREAYAGSFVPREVLLLLAFALMLFLVLSNFHLCGKVGEALFGVMRGLFGVMGYLFPLYFFGSVLFLIANPRSVKAKIKWIASIALFWLLCAFCQLIGTKFDAAVRYTEYYKRGTEGFCGGFFGGLFTKTFLPVFGVIGTAVILLALTIIALVVISERSVVDSVRRGGRHLAQGSRESAQRRRERTREARERIQARAGRRVSGITDQTGLKNGETDDSPVLQPVTSLPSAQDSAEIASAGAGVSGTASPSKTEEPAAAAGRGTDSIRIHGAREDAAAQPADVTEDVTPWASARPRKASPVKLDSDAIYIRTDTRPITEVGALDSLKGTLRDDPSSQGRSGDLRPIFRKGTEEDAIDLSRRGSFFAGEAAEVTGRRTDAVYGRVSDEVEQDYEKLRRKAMAEQAEPDDPDVPSRPQPQPLPSAGKPEGPAETRKTPSASEGESAGEALPAPRPAPRPVPAVSEQKEVVVNYDPLEAPEGTPAADGADPDMIRKVTSSGKVIEREVNDSVFGKSSNPTGSAGRTFSRPGAVSAGTFGGNGTAGASGAQGNRPGTAQSAQPAAKPAKKKPKRPYVAPPLSLLQAGVKGQGAMTKEALRETAAKLQQTLENFGVGVRITDISCGPAVTRYELQPDQGVKVSRIVSLADDIKLSLAAADIRIEAPIPGKSAIGIEVPNSTNQTVYLRDILESESFKKHPSKVAFAVGRDIGGQAVVTDISRMPHLLIAGATGSGKSICINTLIMSIIYKASPEQVKLIMIDPKVVELGMYNGIPHLMVPVVTDPKKASGALKWAVAEMTDRYRKFAEQNVRDLKGYNEKMRERRADGDETAAELPVVVIIVDEFADLMMVAPGEVEDSVCRLAQMARAAGMHLVLATQRPSVNVITGLIKANVPSRIALAVSSSIDSRTIIDMTGAEKLLGKGDMLFFPLGYQKPVRVQGAFVSDSEIESVVKFLKDRNGEVEYDAEMENRMNQIAGDGSSDGSSGGGSEVDELFAAAGQTIIEMDKASIGMLQRKFKIGFNRAARIMDQLAEAGVVGPEEGTKARQILMSQADFESYIESNGL